MPQKWAENKRRLFIVCKPQVIKKPFCCNPPLDQKWAFYKLFLKEETLMLNKEHNLNLGTKTKIRKRDLKEKTRQETKTTERIDGKNQISYFDVVLSMKEKQRNEAKKQRDKKTEAKELSPLLLLFPAILFLFSSALLLLRFCRQTETKDPPPTFVWGRGGFPRPPEKRSR